ncbi:hypothetical protein ACROYT_G019203 [Oculina patagonica]
MWKVRRREGKSRHSSCRTTRLRDQKSVEKRLGDDSRPLKLWSDAWERGRDDSQQVLESAHIRSHMLLLISNKRVPLITRVPHHTSQANHLFYRKFIISPHEVAPSENATVTRLVKFTIYLFWWYVNAVSNSIFLPLSL